MMDGWRLARPVDLPAILDIAAQVHPDHPEAWEVFAERVRLHPPGCLLLEQDGEPCGYVISHPWHRLRPPKLDTSLHALPVRPESYLIHDIALLPPCRGTGRGRAAVLRLQGAAHASGLDEPSLVALPGSRHFWIARGFSSVPLAGEGRTMLAGYGPGAAYMVKRLPR